MSQKCHTCHGKRGYATFETSKSDHCCSPHRQAIATSCEQLRTVANGRDIARTRPQPPNPQSETGTFATHSGKIYERGIVRGTGCIIIVVTIIIVVIIVIVVVAVVLLLIIIIIIISIIIIIIIIVIVIIIIVIIIIIIIIIIIMCSISFMFHCCCHSRFCLKLFVSCCRSRGFGFICVCFVHTCVCQRRTSEFLDTAPVLAVTCDRGDGAFRFFSRKEKGI